ncbi:DUF4328 domain-containing protein [Streptomyces sp. NPDC050617]|uniref:DUF4328 domain-containing protein n=1 Tax=Streptomyces sp. NPDC050617 TaxID=3154628 RepID=UPI00342BD9EE
MSHHPVGPPLGAPAPYPAGGPVLRSPVGLATAVTVLLGAVAAFDLFALYADFNVYSLLDSVLTAPAGELKRADSLYTAAGRLQGLGTIATAVVFIIWFHRVRGNAEIFTQDICTLGRGWSIGAWFVPLANLWLPFRVAAETWQASAPQTPDGALREVSRAPVRAWWVLWLLALAVSRTADNLYNRADTPESLQQAAGAVMFGDLLDLAAAVLAILFVRKLTRMQRERAELGTFAAVMPGGPTIV